MDSEIGAKNSAAMSKAISFGRSIFESLQKYVVREWGCYKTRIDFVKLFVIAPVLLRQA